MKKPERLKNLSLNFYLIIKQRFMFGFFLTSIYILFNCVISKKMKRNVNKYANSDRKTFLFNNDGSLRKEWNQQNTSCSYFYFSPGPVNSYTEKFNFFVKKLSYYGWININRLKQELKIRNQLKWHFIRCIKPQNQTSKFCMKLASTNFVWIRQIITLLK